MLGKLGEKCLCIELHHVHRVAGHVRNCPCVKKFNQHHQVTSRLCYPLRNMLFEFSDFRLLEVYGQIRLVGSLSWVLE